MLKAIDKLRNPIGRSRAWTAARLIENSQIFQDALIVPDTAIAELSLQLCIVPEQKVDKVVRDCGVLKMSELDPMSDSMLAHSRMCDRVR